MAAMFELSAWSVLGVDLVTLLSFLLPIALTWVWTIRSSKIGSLESTGGLTGENKHSQQLQQKGSAVQEDGGVDSPAPRIVCRADSARKQGNSGGYDAIVVGAGVAGSALAYRLAKDNRRVLLVERDWSEQDRIVGELMQPGGVLRLKRMGLQGTLCNIDAQPVFGYGIFLPSTRLKLEYPSLPSSDVVTTEEVATATSAGAPAGPEAADATSSTKAVGWSFHNGRFVQNLRNAAAGEAGVDIVEGTVLGLLEQLGSVRGIRMRVKGDMDQASASARAALSGQKKEPVKAEEGSKSGREKEEVLELRAPITFVCDGGFSKLRSSLTDAQVQVPSSFVGLILEDCDLPFPDHGHVILADPSPILFYRIASNEVRCLVDIPADRKMPSVASGDMATYLTTHVLPQLPPELKEPFAASIARGSFRSMPNRCMSPGNLLQPGAVLVGDSYNMRHPLTGGGMTVALNDVAAVSEKLQSVEDFSDAAAVMQAISAFHKLRTPAASTINTLALALYRVFSHSTDPAHLEMRQASIDYMAQGGECSAGPIALLSGLCPQPSVLILHFFSVALFAMRKMLLPVPMPLKAWTAMRTLWIASWIILPLLHSEKVLSTFVPL